MKADRIQKLVCAGIAVANMALANVALPAANVPGYPDSVNAYDPREVAMLPHYCIYTQLFREHVPGGNNPAEHTRWYEIMGPTFYAMHHYCWGLMKTNRALFLARDRQTKTFYLSASIQEFDYVLRNATPDFILLPEILTKKGENLIRLGRANLGIQTLERAIEIKPDYWPPYVTLSDYYKKSGEPTKARELLRRALALAPDAKALKRRLSELDGGSAGRSASQQR